METEEEEEEEHGWGGRIADVRISCRRKRRKHVKEEMSRGEQDSSTDLLALCFLLMT